MTLRPRPRRTAPDARLRSAVVALSVAGLLGGCGKRNPPDAPITPNVATPATAAAPALALPVAATTTVKSEPWQPPEVLGHYTAHGAEQPIPLSAIRPLVEPQSLQGPLRVQQLAWMTAAKLWAARALLADELGAATSKTLDTAAATALLEESSRAGSAVSWARTQQRAGATRELRLTDAWVRLALTHLVQLAGEPPIAEERIVERYTKRQGRFTTPAVGELDVFSAPDTLQGDEAKRRLIDAAAAALAGTEAQKAAEQHGVLWHQSSGPLSQLPIALEMALRTTKAGAASAVVKSGIGWQIAAVRSIEQAQPLPLASARPQVEAQLREEDRVAARRAVLERVLGKAQLRWTPPLDALVLPASPTSTQ